MPGLKTIHSKDGSPLTDIRASVQRSWLLKDIGQAVFSVAINSPKCLLEYLEYGNLLYIQHDTLPDWVGIIDTPRVWRNGYVEVYAYEPAMLLKYRYPPISYKFTGTPTEKFQMLIDAANTQSDTLMRVENNTVAGDATEEEYSASVYDHIKDLCAKYDAEWMTYPVITENRKLGIGIDFVPRVGVQTDMELAQGRNILYGDAPFEESGELINAIEAMTENSDAQITVVSQSVDAPYGLRALRQSFAGVGSDSLPAIAQNYLAKSKDPTIAAPMTVVDRGGLYSNLSIGNTMKYSYGKVGFSDGGLGVSRKVRIAGFRFNETNGTCELFTENI